MTLRIIDKQKLLADDGASKIESRLTSSFSRFGFELKRISLTVKDVNADKGGVDKECRIIVKLRKSDELVVSSKNESLSAAINIAIKRMERLVSREIDRRSFRDTSRRSSFNFALYGRD